MTLPVIPLSAEIILVIATLVGILSISSIVKGWTTQRWPILGLLSFCIALALGAYVHMIKPEGLVWQDIPDAFILVAAGILN